MKTTNTIIQQMDKRIKRQGGQVVSRLLAALPTKQKIKMGMKEIVTSGDFYTHTYTEHITLFQNNTFPFPLLVFCAYLISN